MVRISIFVFYGQLFTWCFFFFLILWPGINVDSHVVLTVFHFVTVNVVKRKALFQGYTWRGEGRIENRSFPGSRISACDRFRIPNFLIFQFAFHLFIYLSSRQYIITIVICSRLKPQTENFSYVQNPGCLENKRKEKKKISLTNVFLSQYLTARIISFPEIIISFIQFFQCLALAVEGATLTLVTCLVKKCFESSLENLR